MADHDPTDLCAQRQAAAKAEDAARTAQQTQADDIKWLMGSRQGRRVMWRLLEKAGVNRLSFNTNALSMAFAEGNRNLGSMFLADVLDICPDQYIRMLKEHKDNA